MEASDVAHGETETETERVERDTWGDPVVVKWHGGGWAADPRDHDLVLRMHVYRGTMELASEHWYVWDCWCCEWAEDCLRGLDAWAMWSRRPSALPWILGWRGITDSVGAVWVEIYVDDGGGCAWWIARRLPEYDDAAVATVTALESGMRALAGVRP